MAHYKVNSLDEIGVQAATPDSFKPYDVIVHKGIPFYMVVAKLQSYYAEVEVAPVSPGTDLYTKYGYDTSLIVSVTPKP